MAKRRKVYTYVPGDTLHPEETLAWLVEKGWFWVNNLGIFGPDKPPRSLKDFEAYTYAMMILAGSKYVSRSRGHYQSEVRFFLKR